jgi:hypothetical protein
VRYFGCLGIPDTPSNPRYDGLSFIVSHGHSLPLMPTTQPLTQAQKPITIKYLRPGRLRQNQLIGTAR